jgi:V8-like Glu-specific endopeptidase
MSRINNIWRAQRSDVPPPYASGEVTRALPQLSEKRFPDDSDPSRRAVAKVLCFAPGDDAGRFAGTAVFITPSVLLTAAHVVFHPRNYGAVRGGYVEHVELAAPGIDIPTQIKRSHRVLAARGWRQRKEAAADIGIIKLDAAVDAAVPLSPAVVGGDQLVGRQIRVYGYPAPSERLYFSDGTCQAEQAGVLYHTANVLPGDSGSPVLVAERPEPLFVGLHRAGVGETPADLRPSVGAFLITAEALAWVRAMMPRL